MESLTLSTHPKIDELLKTIAVEDVWGIGNQYTKLLNSQGILTAKDLKYSSPKWIKKHLTIVGLRILKELNGEPCIPLEELPPPKKGIICSRSFGKPIETLEEISEAISEYVSRAAQKLRAQNSAASFLQVYVSTNPFKPEPQYANAITSTFLTPTSFTPELIRSAKECIKQIYQPGYQYREAGVFLGGLISQSQIQLSLFSKIDSQQRDKRTALMATLDKVNKRWGSNTLQVASQGIKKPWKMNQSFVSPHYTTRWQEIPVVELKKILLGTILLALVLVVPIPTMAGVNIGVGISLPPIVFNAPPNVVVMPDTYDVYVVPDIDVDLFFWNGWWWRPGKVLVSLTL